jgi:hypothetical protein
MIGLQDLIEEGPGVMSGEAVPLSVVPAALHSASGVISGQAAPLTTTPSAAPTSIEAAGQAGAAVDQAVRAYCAAFAQRLSAVAAGLHGTASAYTAQEVANSQAVAAISPQRLV